MKKIGAVALAVILLQAISNNAAADEPRVSDEKHWFYMVKSKPTDPAREAEYNAWYDDIDIPDVLAVPGFMRARRAIAQELPDFPMAAEFDVDDGKYVALYDIETDDIDKSIIDLYVAARKMGALGRLTDVLKVVAANYYQRIAAPYEKPNAKPAGENRYIYAQKIICCRTQIAKNQFRDWYENTYAPAVSESIRLLRLNLYELYRVMEELAVSQDEIPHILIVYEIAATSASQAVSPLYDVVAKLKAAGRLSEQFIEGESVIYLQMSDVESQ